MLSIEESKKMLNKYGANYSDEEVCIMREFIYTLVEIECKMLKRKEEQILQDNGDKSTKIVSLNNGKYGKNSLPLHPRIHRRAS